MANKGFKGIRRGQETTAVNTKVTHGTGNKQSVVGCEVLTAVVMKHALFWDITSCSLLKVNRHFRGTYRLHL
jgi:hypothetical protein